MAGRIVVFGATGYTGRLVSAALVAQGQKPVLAARSATRLVELSAEFGGLETAVADVARPSSVRALVERGDVLVSTVGPFARWGAPAVEAAIDAGANYLDSTGEPSFIRRVFEDYGPRAKAAGCTLIPAFGHDWVPGNLAGALALQGPGASAARLDVGYFSLGPQDISGGTRASILGAVLDPGYAHRDGHLRAERTGARARAFDLGRGAPRWGVSVGGSEHLALPRGHAVLQDVDVMLGLAGPVASRAVPATTWALAAALRIPLLGSAVRRAIEHSAKGSTGGPTLEQRESSPSLVQAEAMTADGTSLRRIRLRGVNGYTFTADVLAWGAATALAGGLLTAGAAGPVEAFGLEQLTDGAAQAGLHVQA